MRRHRPDIVASKFFIDYIDRTKSIPLIEDIFTQAEQHEMVKALEPS
jgi:hypothetical protein